MTYSRYRSWHEEPCRYRGRGLHAAKHDYLRKTQGWVFPTLSFSVCLTVRILETLLICLVHLTGEEIVVVFAAIPDFGLEVGTPLEKRFFFALEWYRSFRTPW